MGSNSSKPYNESAPLQKEEKEMNLDPRSPTPEISRTPLQNKNGSKHNITKNIDLRKTFESNNDDSELLQNNPILSAVIKSHLQSYDPRSPTTDFERTPIVLESKLEDLRKTVLNKENCASPVLQLDGDEFTSSCEEAEEKRTEVVIPKKLCDEFFDMTINNTLQEEPLGSSTASNEAIEKNNISVNDALPKLLETNFDYVSSGDQISKDDKEMCNYQFVDKQIQAYKILNEDPRSPTTGIERTPIVVAKLEKTDEDNVEEMSDDTLMKVLQTTNAALRQSGTKTLDKNPERLLIYEDETSVIHDTPKKSASTGSRTPLSCMKNKEETHSRSKSANTLRNAKVHDSKDLKQSHIPRLKKLTKHNHNSQTGSTMSLKNISKTPIISGDCENTPPHSHRDKWDKNNSIVL